MYKIEFVFVGQLELSIGGVGLLIDPKNDRVAQWYAGYGALPYSMPPAAGRRGRCA
jgi:hypothetical protein